MTRRQRIPHGKLVKAGNIKSGMTVYHDFKWRSVYRAFFDGRDMYLYFSTGVGSINRSVGRYEPAYLVPVRITVRAAKRTQE